MTLLAQNFHSDNSYNYNEYKKIVFGLAEESKTSGEQSTEKIAATIINAQRIKRIDKQSVISEALLSEIKKIAKKQTWLVLTESWCGDGAQCIPVIAKISEQNESITLKLIFRDEHLEVMDRFLTNGSRSIPKLICIDELTNEVLFTWGPRPQAIQDKVSQLKKLSPEISHEELVKNIHLWYAQDRTEAIQEDFLVLLKGLNSSRFV